MSIKTILSEINNKSIEEIVSEEYRNCIINTKKELSNSDKNCLSKKIAKFKNNSIDYTLKIILIFSVWEPDLAIEVARKKGVFRYNAWNVKTNGSLYLLKTILSYINLFDYSKETIDYLKLKKNLSWLYDYYKETELNSISFIENHYKNRVKIKSDGVIYEESLIKELLVFVELVFNEKRWSIDTNRRDKLFDFGMEEIAEGVSYLIYLCNNVIKNNMSTIPIVNPVFVKSNDIKKIILNSCKMCQMQEWELCIDYFNYKVQCSDHSLTIFSENEIFEKSIRLGYVKNIMQNQLFLQKKADVFPETFGISDVSDLFFEHNLTGFTSVGKGMLSRFKFEIPEIIFEKLYDTNDSFYKEEILEVEYFSKEFIMPVKDLLDKRITNNCTLKDILIFKRFFVFFNMLVEKELYNKKNENKIIASLIPGFDEENLINRLGTFMGSQIKAKELIDFFTFNPKFKLDLQYTPFIKYDNMLLVPMGLVTKSNFLRNCIAYSYLNSNQIVNQDDKECLVSECENIFNISGYDYKVFINQKFKYNNQNGEIDVLIITENSIFIIECKAPLNPTNNFELRASFDHVQKAAKQLTNSKRAFSDKVFRKNYLKGLGIKDNNRNLYTCILMGNRLFNGLSVDMHPVRHIHEMDMILNNGKINSVVGNWCLWDSEHHDENDLINFLSNNNKLVCANFNAMEKYKLVMHIKGKRVEYESFAFNSFSAMLNYDIHFKIEDRNDAEFNKIKNLVENN